MRLYAFLVTLLLQLAVLGHAFQDTYNRPGRWSATDHKNHRAWLSNIARRVDESPEELHPVIKEFEDRIDTTPRLAMLFQSMFNEVPLHYTKQDNGAPQLRNYKHMLRVLNHLIRTAPSYSERKNRMSFVGLPINAVLDWPMGTPSGFAAFIDPEVNQMIQKILNVWGAFLQSPDSAYVLGNEKLDWFGPTALEDLTRVANIGKTNYTFDEMFISDPSDPKHGYTSWDNFFTRLFHDGIRPVSAPDNDSVIVNSCESKPYNVQHNVKGHDAFWVKEQPYSVLDMLGRDPMADRFVGGTIYQAFLSALSYHRWHAPISGKIVKSYIINGTYYSEPLFTGTTSPRDNHTYIDDVGIVTAETYLTSMATRAVIFIEADNPAIGTVAFVGVGMAEVSTCDITVKEGQHVKKGEQLGMFHYGGSTHCLLFENGVNVTGFPEKGGEWNVPVRGELAVVQ
ncbi:hypothetical protein SI65_08910 [Aspergillus cristatus]|uniref:L-tryptophan decarboxylase PsiD-like domain-containing protein n=1 Tax=Aspergillus cristatus TaxID=573508 RepID=A0A1E3B5I1_ASPCR|nr:hypothetical protein SI65_08910 [Aspergillus cristatus]